MDDNKILASKVYSDTTLKRWKKEDLIKHIRMLEQAVSGYIGDQEVWINGYQSTQKENGLLKAKIERLEKRLTESAKMTAEVLEQNIKLQKQVNELTKELSNVPDPFPCKVGSGCEAAGNGCYDCPNNRYRQPAVEQTVNDMGKELYKRVTDNLKMYLRERYDVGVE